MMYQKIAVGNTELEFCACASVNVCYYNVFHEDFIKAISNDGMEATTMMKMAFIMAKFAELNDRKAVNRQTEDDYCNWLDQFSIGDLIEALPSIQEFYMGTATGSASAKKNSAEPNVN